MCRSATWWTGLLVSLGERGAAALDESGVGGRVLHKELEGMEVEGEPGGRGWRFGRGGEGEHDDLVMALALASWRARFKREGDLGDEGVWVVSEQSSQVVKSALAGMPTIGAFLWGLIRMFLQRSLLRRTFHARCVGSLKPRSTSTLGGVDPG